LKLPEEVLRSLAAGLFVHNFSPFSSAADEMKFAFNCPGTAPISAQKVSHEVETIHQTEVSHETEKSHEVEVQGFRGRCVHQPTKLVSGHFNQTGRSSRLSSEISPLMTSHPYQHLRSNNAAVIGEILRHGHERPFVRWTRSLLCWISA
jgi:hypothetical protein